MRVSADPTFRLIGSSKIWDRGTALTSTLHWFETELLTREENLVGLMAVNREVLAQAGMPTRAGRIVLDMDSSESPVHGAQEGSAYNGHFESVCYHPLFLFTEHGDCVAATLRPGNVPSADDWDDLLLPEIERQQAEGNRVAFRADAAFAKPEIYDALEKRDVDYAIRIPANKPGFPFCQPDQGLYTPTRLSARQISSSHVASLPVEAALDVEPSRAPAFRASLRHRSTPMLFLRQADFVALRPGVSRPAPVAPRSSAACRRTAAGSDALLPAGARSTAHASPGGLRFSPAAADDS